MLESRCNLFHSATLFLEHSFEIRPSVSGLRSFGMNVVDPYIVLTRSPVLDGESNVVQVFRSNYLSNVCGDSAPLILGQFPYADSLVRRNVSAESIMTLSLYDSQGSTARY